MKFILLLAVLAAGVSCVPHADSSSTPARVGTATSDPADQVGHYPGDEGYETPSTAEIKELQDQFAHGLQDLSIRNPQDSVPQEHWRITCQTFWGNSNCWRHGYVCNVKGRLSHNGTAVEECDRFCKCSPLMPLPKPGHDLHLATTDHRLRPVPRHPSPEPQSSPPNSSQNSVKPLLHYWSLVCETTWAGHICVNKPYFYWCNEAAEIIRFGVQNIVCDTRCRCYDVETNKWGPKYTSSTYCKPYEHSAICNLPPIGPPGGPKTGRLAFRQTPDSNPPIGGKRESTSLVVRQTTKPPTDHRLRPVPRDPSLELQPPAPDPNSLEKRRGGGLWILICGDLWSTINCPKDPYLYKCVDPGRFIRTGSQSLIICDYRCRCFDLETGRFPGNTGPATYCPPLYPPAICNGAPPAPNPPSGPGKRESTSLAVREAPKPPSNKRYYGRWIMLCRTRQMTYECSHTYTYECGVFGVLIYADWRKVPDCELTCNCYNLDDGKVQPGNGYGVYCPIRNTPPVPVNCGPGLKRNLASDANAPDAKTLRSIAIRQTSEPPSNKRAPNGGNWAMLCDNLLTTHLCWEEDLYECGPYGQLFRRKPGIVPACEHTCKCYNLDTMAVNGPNIPSTYCPVTDADCIPGWPGFPVNPAGGGKPGRMGLRRAPNSVSGRSNEG